DGLLTQRHTLLRQVAQLTARRDRLQSDLGAVQFAAGSVRRELVARRLDVQQLREAGQAKDELIGGLETLKAELETRKAELEAETEARERTIESLHHDLAQVEAVAETLRHELAETREVADALQRDVSQLQHSTKDKDELIAGLSYHLLALQRTIGWKILERIRRVRDFFFPPDSGRRDLYWRLPRAPDVLRAQGPGAAVR